ncbi:MAG: glycoside hydrolase family 31 protein [Rikenellaceae bacterium]
MRLKQLLIATTSMLLALPFTVIGAQFALPFTQDANSLTLKMSDKEVKIEVMSDKIMHVSKTPLNKGYYSVPELVVTMQPQATKWELKQTANKLTIKTPSLEVNISDKGVIEYVNSKGKQLISETLEESYIDLTKTEGYMISQGFTCEDEALYGLGQYQSGIMNWKHVPATFIQYNQEVVIPFILSTKNYGILWNNYSVSQFNPASKEITFQGQEAGSTAVKTLSQGAESEDVAKIKFKDNGKKNIRETTFTPKQTGRYAFHVHCDNVHKAKGVVSLSLDGDTIINYETMWLPQNYSGVKELEAGKTYKVIFENTGSEIAGNVYYNSPDYNKTVFASTKATSVDYYVVAGESPAEIIELNHKLTGQTPMFSKKTYGFWQCRERYNNQKQLMDVAKEMRAKKIPFDIIIQDWQYWPGKTKGPEWERKRYPSPEGMTKELAEMNAELMVSVWPMLKNKPTEKKRKIEDCFLNGSNYFDFWDQRKGNAFYELVRDSMFNMGVSSIWLDGSEPGSEFKDVSFQTGAGVYSYVVNTYSLMVTKAMYEGQRKDEPNRRVMNLTRSAFSGQQRYGAVTWSGDVQSSWEQFAEQISAGLNFTMAGVPYWTHDAGGFFRDSKSMNPRYKSQYTDKNFIELLTRWFQFATFSPIFRIHGYKSTTEIWNYGKEFESTARKFIDLRYKFLPYIYSEAWKVTQRGHAMMSPLAYYYPQDKNTWDIDDQIFFGENVMVALVTKYGQREKEIYLPQGEWYEFFTDKKVKGGGCIKVATPLDSTPVYVKASSIIPYGAKVQYATEPTKEPMRIKIYPGDKEAEYTLYIDDNQTYDYEKGEYSEVKFSYKKRTLTIEKGEGNFQDFSAKPLELEIEVAGEKKTQKTTFKGSTLKIKL